MTEDDSAADDPVADDSAEASVAEEEAMERASREALARARASARERGFRPGAPGVKAVKKPRKVPGQLAGSGRDPLLLGDELTKLVNERGWEVDIAAGAVMERWADLVGPQIAQHASPVTFADSVLTVRAESTAWATQLNLISSTILAAIEQGVGAGVVSELIIRGPAAPSWSKGPRRSRGPGPRDTYG